MTDIFAVEIPTRTAGLAVRAEAGFRFYASDQTFAALEGRSYDRLEDIHTDVRRLAKTPRVPALSRTRGKRRARQGPRGRA
jgi:hypothetical protein